MPTESDLRRALFEFADANASDPAEIRVRIERELPEPGRRQPSRFWPAAAGFAAAACVVAVVVAALAVAGLRVRFADSHTSTTHTSTTHTSTPHTSATRTPNTPRPSSVKPALPGLPAPSFAPLPGTVRLADFHGTGPQKIILGRYPVASGQVLATAVDCLGPGRLRVFDGSGSYTELEGCEGGGSVGTNMSRSNRELRVAADLHTKWWLAIAVQPDVRTNGAFQNPADFELAHPVPSELHARATGRGSASVALSGRAKSAKLRVILTCAGHGVSLTSADSAFDGKYTRTCFAGFSYSFDISGARLPGRLFVHADGATTWKLVVIDR